MINTKEYTIFSGGASGSDQNWMHFGKKAGVGNIVIYRAEDIPRQSNKTKLDMEVAYRNAAALLKRPYLEAKSYSGGLVRRNYLIIKDADHVFAVGLIKSGLGFIDSRETREYVDGGTAYGVEMAIALKKLVTVFDLRTNQWYFWSHKDGKYYEAPAPPVLDKYSACIGTRKITPTGIREIISVYNRTFDLSISLDIFGYDDQ